MAKTSGLAKALRSRIGRRCYFKHPETGNVIEGYYHRGRKVVETTGVRRFVAGGVHGFNIEETTWTVPAHVRITFGQPPIEVK